MDDYIIQITLGILVFLWTLVGVKDTKLNKRKKYPLKTRLLKKLRKQARNVCYLRAHIRNKRLYYTIEVMQDCPHIYGKKFGVLLFGTYNKEEAIEEIDYIRRQWILVKVYQIKDERLALRLDEINRELLNI